MRGLDPRIHADLKALEDVATAWIAGSSPAMTIQVCDSEFA
jgi:hypothetical protein